MAGNRRKGDRKRVGGQFYSFSRSHVVILAMVNGGGALGAV